MIDAFKKLYALLDTRGRRRFALLVILMLFDALLEIAALHLVPAYVGLVAYPERVEALLPEGWHLDSHRQLIFWASITIALFFAVKLVINTHIAMGRIRFAQQTASELSTRLLNAYLHAPHEYHLTHNSAEIQRNLNSESIQLTDQVLIPLGDILSQGAILVAILAVFLIYIPPAALALLVGILVVAAYAAHSQQRRLQQEGRDVQQLQGKLIKNATEALACAKEIALTGRQSFFVNRFRNTFSEMMRRQRHIQILTGRLIPGSVELATIIALACMIYLLFRQGQGSQQVLAVVTVAAVGLARLKGTLSSLMRAQSLLRHRQAGLDTIYHDLKHLENRPTSAATRRTISPFRDALVLEDVWYRYPETEHDVLRGINLTIHKGDAIGFSGKTGTGKSTLIDLIIGLLEPTQGRLLVDNLPLDEQLPDWQRHIGYVPQLHSLVDGTIRENIALGLPPGEIDERALQRAIDQAQLSELVVRLPDGLDTVIGERGIRLSGGQRQRITIARALYDDPAILILDEGTSALDDETERDLMAAVEGLRGTKTILMIAHRLSTLSSCDRIFSLRDGQLLPMKLDGFKLLQAGQDR